MTNKSHPILETGSGNRLHRPRIEELLRGKSGIVRIASAFVTERKLLKDAPKQDIRLLISLLPMDVVSGATSTETLGALISSGVACRYLSQRPRFHAKTYIFGSENAIVTSANLTNNAFDFNIEAGVEISGSKVQEVIDWYDRLWEMASPLTVTKLADLQRETSALRREYQKLKLKSRKKLRIPPAQKAKSQLSDSLVKLFENAGKYFLCNTDRKHAEQTPTGGYHFEEQMRNAGYATAWEDFKYESHMEMVEPGDAIFMFAKGVGIIGIGVAEKPHEILKPGSAKRVSNDHSTTEWRVPVKWLAWTDEAGAYPYKSPNCTFLNITDEKYGDLRLGVKSHFVGDVDAA